MEEFPDVIHIYVLPVFEFKYWSFTSPAKPVILPLVPVKAVPEDHLLPAAPALPFIFPILDQLPEDF